LQPSLVVYLFSDIKRLQKNIKKRGRVFEQNISDLYLTDIQDMYLDYLRKQKDFPVLILDVTGVDFVLDDNAYQAIQKTIEGNYDIGIHHKLIV
jgi:deoxyadenosine/deoxycytidine kinase